MLQVCGVLGLQADALEWNGWFFFQRDEYVRIDFFQRDEHVLIDQDSQCCHGRWLSGMCTQGIQGQSAVDEVEGVGGECDEAMEGVQCAGGLRR